ncbi:MAG: HAMP domain-containing protein, partial [Synergistaceae bacterium]|nr:HAMP domain-containing protein [Synergistaceae bacterium]
MKNAIWKKFLFFAVIPFLVVFVLLSFIIVKAVYQDKISQAAMDVRALSMYNETNLREHLDSVRVSLLTAISELEKIGLDNPNARRRGQNIVISMMENRYIYNAWLAYEPMAFDGRDPDFPSDYPGAPSGRYIRSFVRVGNEYVVTPEMDENSIDDPARSPWYTIPKETDKAAVDLVKSPMYDYRLGDGYKNSLCISMPIHRDGKVIGVVGADILLNQTLLGLEVSQGAISALFNDKYQVISAPDIGDVGKFIDDLGFTSPDEIKSALDGASDRFLRVGHSPFINARAYTYIKPMRIDGLDGLLYLYEAIPEDAVNKALSNVLMPIAASLLTAILLFLALLFYISHTISKPIQRLTAAADAISRGDLDMEIAPSNSNDEMSVLTRSLHRLVEQLRVYITLLERSGKLLDLYTRLNEAAYHNADIKDTFDTMARDICAFFGVSAASLVFTADGVPSLLSSFDASSGFSPQPKL